MAAVAGVVRRMVPAMLRHMCARFRRTATADGVIIRVGARGMVRAYTIRSMATRWREELVGMATTVAITGIGIADAGYD